MTITSNIFFISFFNSIVYGLNDGVRSKLASKIPIFYKIESYLTAFRNGFYFCICCCCYLLRKNNYEISQTPEEKKKWYNSFIEEYNEKSINSSEGDHLLQSQFYEEGIFESVEEDSFVQ